MAVAGRVPSFGPSGIVVTPRHPLACRRQTSLWRPGVAATGAWLCAPEAGRSVLSSGSTRPSVPPACSTATIIHLLYPTTYPTLLSHDVLSWLRYCCTISLLELEVEITSAFACYSPSSS